MNALVIIALLLGGGGSLGGGGLSGNALPPGAMTQGQYATQGDTTYYVDASSGSDSNDCLSPGAGACLTIQGAVNKAPKNLRHPVRVLPAAGTYGCFRITGFTCDQGLTLDGGFSVDGLGAMTTSTLTTGSATGTFTSSTAGSGTTFGTGTDTGATWTVNDLVGRFVVSAGQTRVISSNTATAITIVGTWTSPGAVAYTIQDPGVIINTGCTAPATPLNATTTSNSAIWVTNNTCPVRAGMFTLRGIRTTNATSAAGGVTHDDNSGLALTLMQLRSVGDSEIKAGFASGSISGPGGSSGPGNIFITDVDTLTDPGSVNAAVLASGGESVTVNRLLIRGAHTGFQLSGGIPTADVTALDAQATVGSGLGVTSGSVVQFVGSHIDCSASSKIGISIGSAGSSTSGRPSFASIGGALVSTCGWGIFVSGSTANADLTGLTGTAATNAILVDASGNVTVTTGSTITGTTSDISLDEGFVTGALGDVSAATCLTSASSGARVCKR